jgi:uncharacterized Zn-finger protein
MEWHESKVIKESFTQNIPERATLYNFICSICDRGLTSQEDLDAHMESHNKDLKLPCPSPDCTEIFMKNTQLLSHMITAHQIS